MKRQDGFSLLQLLVVMLVVGVLVLGAYPVYRDYVRDARLREVQAALLENALFLERFYRQRGSFKLNSTRWPDLPVRSAGGFCIRISGQARGILNEKFTLKAVAEDVEQVPRVMKMNENLTTVVCESSTNSCDGTDNFFTERDKKKAADTKCRIWKKR